jgi:methionine-rich copper-binding protein CopC
MKLFDFFSAALRALMSGAVALMVSSSALAHAHLISRAPVDSQDARLMRAARRQLDAGRYPVHPVAVATDGHRTQRDFAFNVK